MGLNDINVTIRVVVIVVASAVAVGVVAVAAIGGVEARNTLRTNDPVMS